MQYRSIKFFWITVLIHVFATTSADAGFFDIFDPATTTAAAKTTTDIKPTTTAVALPATTTDSGLLNSLLPTTTTTTTTTHVVISSAPASTIPTTTVMPLSTTQSTTSTTASPTTSSSPSSTSSQSSSGNNTPIIIGTVCGFLGILGAGFIFAFCAKARRSNRKKRGFDANRHDEFGASPFDNPRNRSPAMTNANLSDTFHSNKPLPQEVPYGNTDAYYSSPPLPNAALSPAMSYPDAAFAGNYYVQSPQPYYDPVYQGQQHYMYHSPSPVPAHLPVPVSSAGPVYSAPNAYDEMEQQQQHHHPGLQHPTGYQ